MSDYISKLCDIGGKVYIVGGANRNYLYNCIHKTNNTSKDVDYLVCNLTQNEIINALSEFGKVKEIGHAFGIILFSHKLNNEKYESIEFALPRTEISTGSGYRDFIITPDPYLPIEDDFSRRDSPINAIGFQVYSVNDVKLLNHDENPEPDFTRFCDPFDGINNIRKKVWSAIGDPYKRFLEDPTRIMRAFRQAAELEMEIESNTLKAIVDNYDIMKTLIPESYVRLFNELLKLIKVNKPGKLLRTMSDIGILKFLGIETNINDELENKLNTNILIVKFALILNPEKKENQIKKWINERQILATTNFTQLDLNVLVAIESFANEIHNLIINECCVETLRFSLLKIREKIYKYAKFDSTYVLEQILFYIKAKHDINLNVNFLLKDFDKYIMSTDQLVISGNIMQEKWNIKGKEIATLKTILINEIFLNKMSNNAEQLTEFINKSYLTLN